MKKTVCSVFAASFAAVALISCAEKNVKPISPATMTATFFSDLHYGNHDYNDFTCKRGLEKLGRTIAETPNSDFYVNLGDFIDNMEKKTSLYEEAINFLKERNIEIYNIGKNKAENSRFMYTLIGNHETNTYPKANIGSILPYVEGVGQVFRFKSCGILFVAIDANFNRENGSDAMADMYCTAFTIPDKQIEWFKKTVDDNLTDDVKELVILSHIAAKDIKQSVFWQLIDYVTENYPSHHITMFDGHTHARAYNDYTDDVTNISYFTEYTLPAVTSGSKYEYYNVTFKDGAIEKVDMILNNDIDK